MLVYSLVVYFVGVFLFCFWQLTSLLWLSVLLLFMVPLLVLFYSHLPCYCHFGGGGGGGYSEFFVFSIYDFSITPYFPVRMIYRS